MIGLNISHYRVIEKLGEGGMGVVYVAEDINLGRLVALKALPKRFVQDAMRRKRFTIEARAAAALNHPGIAAVHELIEDGDDLYIAMELVHGESLRSDVKTPPLAADRVLEIFIQVARGLVAAHKQGVIHRDLKPENILRSASGEIKILDFGLAKLISTLPEGMTQSGNLTGSGVFMGTISYMSPEQLESKPVDARSDIFSVGVIMYELATGTHPFGGSSNASTIANILTVEPPPLQYHRVSASPELDRIVSKCLRKDPANRYQTSADLLADLEALQRAGRSPSSGWVSSDAAAETIVRRALQPVGPSPRRWWELNQYFCLAAFPLVAYWIWRVRPWIPADWGTLIFFAAVLLVSCSMTMRLYLLMMSGFHPANLHTEVVRWALAIRITTLGMWLVLGAVAALIVRQHVGVGSIMGGLAVGGWLSTMVAESAIDSHAFPR
jgi:serine/threonine protein kinase